MAAAPRLKSIISCLLVASAFLAVQALAAYVETYERARALLGTDPKAGAEMLERLARAGDALSQFQIGAMLLEGKNVPQDRPLGLAYMKLAERNELLELRRGRATVDPAFRAQAREMVRYYESQLSGSELIATDQHLAAIAAKQADSDKVDSTRMQRALKPYTSETAVRARPTIGFAGESVQISVPPVVDEGQAMRLGCAAEHRGGGCRGAPEPRTVGHCTGRIPLSDAPAKSYGDEARVVLPRFPPALMATSDGGTAMVMAHIDHSGFVCSVIVTESAGHPRLDAAVLEAVRQWKFVPAKKAETPVEALQEFAITLTVGP